MLVSGSADGNIIVWQVDTGAKLFTLRGHTRGILDLAIDPVQSPDMIIFSAASTPEIRRWKIDADLQHAIEIHTEEAILEHSTSINAVRFDSDGDLWTASSDGTAKCLSRDRGWRAESTYGRESAKETNYIRSIAIDELYGHVCTVGRDEDVYIWDRASGSLIRRFSGHFDEITCTVVVSSGSAVRLVTAGIDRTVRSWSLLPADLANTEQEALPEAENIVTADEEQELAELMDQ